MDMDILARLRNGETTDALAKEFTEALNAANKTYIEEQKNKELQAKRDQHKQEDFQEIMDMILDYIDEYLPDSPLRNAEVDSKLVMPFFDKAFTGCDKIATNGIKVESKLDPKTGKVETKSEKMDEKEVQKTMKQVDDVFNRFFKKYGL